MTDSVQGSKAPGQPPTVGAFKARDTIGSQARFVLLLLAMYGICRLISPWTTLGAFLFCALMALVPKWIASDPKVSISAEAVKRLSLIMAGIFLLTGIMQITDYVDASEMTREEAAEIRRTNIVEIRKIEAELREIPTEADIMNRDRYSLLTKLDPGNATYAAKAQKYQAEVDRVEYLADHPVEALELVKSQWVSRTGFNRIAVMDFTIKNTAGWTIRDPIVTCHYFGNSGTAVSVVSDTIYEPIKSGETRSFRGRSLGFINGANARSASCSISGANGK